MASSGIVEAGTCPQFDGSQRIELRKNGLTAEQVEALERRLTGVQRLLDPDPSASDDDVVLLLNKLVENLQSVNTLLGASDASPRAGVQAKAWLTLATPESKSLIEAFTGSLPPVIDAAQAAADLFARRSKTGNDKRFVIELVLDALATPEDAASRKVAGKLKPARGRKGVAANAATSRAHFANVVKITVEAATGERPRDIGRWIEAWKQEPIGVLMAAARRHGYGDISANPDT